MANYYGYCRVSSSRQGKRGTIDEQVKPVKDYLLHHGLNNTNVNHYMYRDTFTGTTMNRPHFNKMIRKLRDGDIVVVYRLDRLSRNGLNAMNFIQKHPHVTFHVLQPSMDLSADDKASNRFIHDMMILFAQFDHDIVMARFNDGKARVKAQIKAGKIKPYNYHGGQQKRFYGKKKAHYDAIYKYTANHSERETAKVFNCAVSTVQRIKNAGRRYHSIKEAKETNPNQTELIKSRK